jgi:hypothetical protein
MGIFLNPSGMTPKQIQDTQELLGLDLRQLLVTKGVDVEGLGGWKFG